MAGEGTVKRCAEHSRTLRISVWGGIGGGAAPIALTVQRIGRALVFYPRNRCTISHTPNGHTEGVKKRLVTRAADETGDQSGP